VASTHTQTVARAAALTGARAHRLDDRHQHNIMSRNAKLPDLSRAVVVGVGTDPGVGVSGLPTSTKSVEALLSAERLR